MYCIQHSHRAFCTFPQASSDPLTLLIFHPTYSKPQTSSKSFRQQECSISIKKPVSFKMRLETPIDSFELLVALGSTSLLLHHDEVLFIQGKLSKDSDLIMSRPK
jgi:hypothetical protein